MLIDLTLQITPRLLQDAMHLKNPALMGHWGTHFDVMEQEFPLTYTERNGIVFDVSSVSGRDIDLCDIDPSKLSAGMFTAFYSGFSEKVGYGDAGYFSEHPVLSKELIECLLQKGVSVIGVDFAGIRRGEEHIPADRHCAAHGTFVVENLVNLQALLSCGGTGIVHTYPMNLVGATGIPCRVIAEV